MKLAIVCYGDSEYFSDDRNLPYIALESFRRSFGDLVDYYCVSTSLLAPEKASRLNFKYSQMDLPSIYSESSYTHGHGGRKIHYPSEIYLFSQIYDNFLALGYDFTLVIDGDTYCHRKFDFDFLDFRNCIFAVEEPLGTFDINTGVVFYGNKACEKIKFSSLCEELYQQVSHSADQPFINKLIRDNSSISVKRIPYIYNFIFFNKKVYKKQSVKNFFGFNPLAMDPSSVAVGHFIRNQTQKYTRHKNGGPLIKVNNSKRNYKIRNTLLKNWEEIRDDIGKQLI